MINEQTIELISIQREFLGLIETGRLTLSELREIVRQKKKIDYPVIANLQLTPFGSLRDLKTYLGTLMPENSFSTRETEQALGEIVRKTANKSPGKYIKFCAPTAGELTGEKEDHVSLGDIFIGIKRQGYKLCFACAAPHLMRELHTDESPGYFVAMKPIQLPDGQLLDGEEKGIFYLDTGRDPEIRFTDIDFGKKAYSPRTQWIVVKG